MIWDAGYWPHVAVGLLALVEVWGCVVAARVCVALARWKTGTVRLQFQLRTIWVLMVAASVLLFLNLRGDPTTHGRRFVGYGFPDLLYYRVGDPFRWSLVIGWHWNLFLGLGVLGLLALVCEKVLWRRTQAVSDILPALVPSLRPGEMSVRERWISALPLFLLFALIWSCGIPLQSIPAGYPYYREFGVFGEMFLTLSAACETYSMTVAVAMTLTAWLYFRTISRDRLHARIVNRMLWILIFVLLFMMTMQLVSMYFPIPRGMRKK